ncbi:MAG TPA: response regulator [Bdellovibrionota bacterium]|jgi:two-component system response regulator|nr:response regulator [Bdellovibrionota bacterium]
METNTILLVEDNRDDEDLTRRAFKKARIKNELIVIRDGAEALDYLFCTGQHAKRNPDDMPQVVLLDLKLPKVNGLDVLKKIRGDARTKLLPVIILTSSREEGDLLDGYAGGANSYIVKPVDTAQFEQCIQQLGLYWLVLNETVKKA